MTKFINHALFIEQLKRFWAIGALTFLAFFLGIYLPLNQNLMRGNNSWILSGFSDLFEFSNFFFLILMFIIPLSAVLALFSYSNKEPSTTAFHCFPVNKKQLFFSNLAAGLVLMLVPLLVLCVLLVMPPTVVHLYEWDSLIMAQVRVGSGVINTVPQVAMFFLRASIGFSFYFSLFALAASVTGNRVVTGLLSLVFPVIPFGILMLVAGAGELYLFGINTFGNTMERVAIYVLMFINPVSWNEVLSGMVRRGMMGGGGLPPDLPIIFIYIFILSVFTAIACWCYHKRKQERAGDSIVFVPIKNILVFLLSLAGMVFFGTFIMAMAGARFWLYPGFIIGFVLTYFIAQMIAEKTFMVRNKIKSLIPFGLVMVGIYAAVLFVTHVGLRGVVNFVPQHHQVVGVSFRPQHNLHSFVDGRRIIVDETIITNHHVLTNTFDIHKAILNERRMVEAFMWNNDIGRRGRQPSHRLNINYIMADGRIINRQYTLPESFARNIGIMDVMDNPHVIFADHPALLRPNTITRLSFVYMHDEENTTIEITRSNPNFDFFIDAIKHDIIYNNAMNTNTPRADRVTIRFTLHEDFRNTHRTPEIVVLRNGRLSQLLRITDL